MPFIQTRTWSTRLVKEMDCNISKPFNISVEELALKGARKEGFLEWKQYMISNKLLNKIIKLKKC